MPRFEFESGRFRWFYPHYHVRMEKDICLSRGVQVTGATWQTVMRIVAGVGDLVQRIGDGQAKVEYSVARRLRVRVMLCMVGTVHEETRSVGFLVWLQNQGRRFPLVWPQNWWLRFPGLCLKICSYGLMI